MATNEQMQAAGLKAVNIAREAFDDAGYTVSAPGNSDPGEFYVEFDNVNIAVKVEIL